MNRRNALNENVRTGQSDKCVEREREREREREMSVYVGVREREGELPHPLSRVRLVFRTQ